MAAKGTKAMLGKILGNAKRNTIKAGNQEAVLYGVTIDPEDAEEWLEVCNLRNRDVRRYKVDAYTKRMLGSEWRLENVLKVTDTGVLIDGQHRLLACAQAEEPQPFMLQVIPSREADKSNLATDENVPRNLQDFLTFNGIANATRVAPLLVAERNARITGNPFTSVRSEKPDYLKLYKSIGEDTIAKALCAAPARLHTRLKVRRAVVDWVALQLVQVDEAHAQTFFGMVDNPASLRETDAPYVLNRRLMEIAAQTTKTKRTHPPVEYATMFVRAWNAYYEGKPVTAHGIRYRIADAFPPIYGTKTEE